jgi:tetratricopeptide (TPR) repeat protein
MYGFEDLNRIALETLEEGRFIEAQKLFRENASKNPSGVSLNNLGAYYYCEGMSLPNGSLRKVPQLALRYFKRAEEYTVSAQTQMAMGDIYFSQRDYSKACSYDY